MSDYEQLARELGIERGQLEKGFDPWDKFSISMMQGPAHLPPGQIPIPQIEKPFEDLSHLNTKAWITHQKNGTRGGRKNSTA